MSNLARYSSSVSVIDAEIIAESYLQRVPVEFQSYLRQPIVHLAQQGEVGSIHQLVRAAVDGESAKLYRWLRELQPEIDALKRRQDALENRVERLERRPSYSPAAEYEPPTNFQLLSIITLLVILAAMLIGGSIERDISTPYQPERIRIEREGQR